MKEYMDHYYYLNSFKGELIPSNLLEKYARKASSKVKYYTSNRINEENINDDIRTATCEIAELLFNQENLKSKIANTETLQKSSETLGPRSITYINNSQYQDKQIMTEKEIDNSIYDICKEYIDDELLYRGI